MMTTNKLTKTFAYGSLAIGVLAGSVLTATSASAAGNAVILPWGTWTGGTPLVLNDGTTATFGSKTATFTPNASDEVGLFFLGNEYEFQYNATTLASPDLYSGEGSFTYTITFAKAVNGVAIDTDVTGTDYGDVTKTLLGIPPFPFLTSTDGSADPLSGFKGIPSTLSLTVTDTFKPNVPGGPEALSTVSNNFGLKTVPEPGTILGLLAVGGLGMVSRFKKQK